jgi:uncharacterized protein with HEPN domain
VSSKERDYKYLSDMLPWRSLHDFGNFYQHAYFSVDTALVWRAATGPELDLMEKMLREELPFGNTL